MKKPVSEMTLLEIDMEIRSIAPRLIELVSRAESISAELRAEDREIREDMIAWARRWAQSLSEAAVAELLRSDPLPER